MIYNSGLYAPQFIKTFGVDSPHWFSSNWHSRELSLRHDMVCVLLCNLEEFSIEETVRSSTESSKGEQSSGPSTVKSPSDEFARPTGVLEMEPDEGEMEATNYEVEMREKVEQMVVEEEITKRFILLEGLTNVAQRQNMIADSWGCNRPNSQWDIIDRELHKFIEVKVALNERKAIQTFEQKSEDLYEYSSLFVIRPDNANHTWHRHPEGLHGEASH